MILQALADITLIRECGTSLHGPGELLDLPMRECCKILNINARAFKILSPTPLLPGVAVCWNLRDRVYGPGIAQLVDGEAPVRTVAVQTDDGLQWIPEEAIIDVDPWPLIDAKVDQLVDIVLAKGEEAPEVYAVREWIHEHFERDET